MGKPTMEIKNCLFFGKCVCVCVGRNIDKPLLTVTTDDKIILDSVILISRDVFETMATPDSTLIRSRGTADTQWPF